MNPCNRILGERNIPLYITTLCRGKAVFQEDGCGSSVWEKRTKPQHLLQLGTEDVSVMAFFLKEKAFFFRGGLGQEISEAGAG